MSRIAIVPVAGTKTFLDFCKVPRLIYKGAKGFAPPLDAERWTLHGAKLNPHFELVDHKEWVARKDGKLAGRISAQVYKDGHTPVGASRMQFGCLDAIEDEAVVDAPQAAYQASQMHKHMMSLRQSTLKGQAGLAMEDINLIGSVDAVVEKALRLKAAGVTHFLGLYFAANDVQDLIDQMQLFAEEVTPRIV